MLTRSCGHGSQPWLLPANIADILPKQARKIEVLRRRILDNFELYGYEIVMPPLLEYLESLLTGAGQDMNLYTYKLVDQLSGRILGIRADMTTQAARIDAHLLNRDAVTRLCYVGSVLHTEPIGLDTTREPLQMGAEIYGHAGIEADAEVQELILTSLAQAGIDNIHLDLCHAGLFHAIIASDSQTRGQTAELFSLLEAKDIAGLQNITASYAPTTRSALLALPRLHGDIHIIQAARSLLPPLPGIGQALDELQTLARLSTQCSNPTAQISIDLADLRGYHYHSGVMFAAFAAGLPNAIARGGRYDHVGEAFGRARPATGFSMDLRELAKLAPALPDKPAIRAPWSTDPALHEKITALRQAGETVIQCLAGSDHGQNEYHCNRVLTDHYGDWIVATLE